MSDAFRLRAVAAWWCAAAALVLLGGCSKPRFGGDLSGAVKLGGKPVTNGAITVHGADGRTAIGEVMDGRYTVRKPPFGPCKVTILTAPPPPPGNGIDPDPKWLKPPGYLEVPERYGKIETSRLTVEVIEDPQSKDFDLDFK
jgi:hypothetical protein